MNEHILVYGGPGWGWGGGPWWSSAPWWGLGALFVVVVVAVCVVGYLARSRLRRFGPPSRAGGLSAAEDLLARRFAAGEISEQEYASRLAVLRGAGS